MSSECTKEHLALLLRQRAERTKDVDDRIVFRLAADALEQVGVYAVEEQDKPSAVCTSPLPTTLEEYESLKLFWRGEGYAVGLRCRAGAVAFGGRQSLPAVLQDWLIEIEEYLQDHHDIRDGELGGQHPLPNDAMSLSNALKCALGEQP